MYLRDHIALGMLSFRWLQHRSHLTRMQCTPDGSVYWGMAFAWGGFKPRNYGSLALVALIAIILWRNWSAIHHKKMPIVSQCEAKLVWYHYCDQKGSGWACKSSIFWGHSGCNRAPKRVPAVIKHFICAPCILTEEERAKSGNGLSQQIAGIWINAWEGHDHTMVICTTWSLV